MKGKQQGMVKHPELATAESCYTSRPHGLGERSSHKNSVEMPVDMGEHYSVGAVAIEKKQRHYQKGARQEGGQGINSPTLPLSHLVTTIQF